MNSSFHSNSRVQPSGIGPAPLMKGDRILNRAIVPEARAVVKRDGSRAHFDLSKITRAIALAFFDVRNPETPNRYRNDPLACYGLDSETFATVNEIASHVSQMLELYYRDGKHPTIDQIQDAVEKSIAAAGHWDVARSFVLYRARHAERRLTRYTDNGLSDYIMMAKYARYRPELHRRETYAQGVDRVLDMHLQFFSSKIGRAAPTELPADVAKLAGANAEILASTCTGKDLGRIIRDVFAEVSQKRVLPSMRSLQFGGPAILTNQSRMFNCSFSNVDRIEFFRGYFFLLLSGCGVGFSVQKHHIAMLPTLPARRPEHDLPVLHYTIADTIEGWADALNSLILSYYEGRKIEFNYSAIRPRGSPLKTSGGRAPGHLPLKEALGRIDGILSQAVGRALRPIEVYDMNMFIARAVLAGGIRRSATICLFSPDDTEMLNAKTGNWFEKHPQRSASNNSAVLSRSQEQVEHFRKLFQAQKEFGEPGFYFCDNPDAGCNPCAEIGLVPVVNWTLEPGELEKLYAGGYTGDFPGTVRLSGFQHCNLTTINGGTVSTAEDFYRSCISATVIGTLQAAYSDMPYLGPVTRLINEHDALLGVSICGYMDNPKILFDADVLNQGARLCRATNKFIATLIGIRPAARICTTKPEGTASLLLNAASGIHPHHARRYFRRVQANRKEPIYSFFRQVNPQMTESSVYNPDTDDVITFPVEAPRQAIIRKDLNAKQFLELVRLVQQAWVLVGAADDTRNPEVTHNVSNTCTVRNDEWSEVADFIWENRAYFTGIALLQEAGDKTYPQAPREEVLTETDIARWNSLRPQRVDYTQMREDSDETELKETVACAGGACEVDPLMRAGSVSK